MKNASEITATSASTTMVVDENQSRSLPLSSITCNEPTQRISRPRPPPSIGAFLMTESRLRKIDHVATAAIAPTGKLTKKIHGHVRQSELQPPRIHHGATPNWRARTPI